MIPTTSDVLPCPFCGITPVYHLEENREIETWRCRLSQDAINDMARYSAPMRYQVDHRNFRHTVWNAGA